MIIGLVGYKRSGKNTVADFLEGRYDFRPYALAGPIKRICCNIFNWDYRHTEGELKEVLDPYWGISPRSAMQWIGTEAFQKYLPRDFELFDAVTGRLIWTRLFIKWYEEKVVSDGTYGMCDCPDAVITDVRFPHEVETINKELKQYKPVFIRINRPGLSHKDRHESEAHIDELPVVAEIGNASNSVVDFKMELKDFFYKFFLTYCE